jgi:Fungal specific transcription factor domain
VEPPSAHSSPQTPGVSPIYPLGYASSIGQSSDHLLTPNTTPKEQKADPFADLFCPDYDEDSATDLSSFLSSSSIVTSTPERRPSDEDLSGSSYFNFFLTELSQCFPYVNLFPWTAATLFSSSNHNPALRQSVFAVAALIADQSKLGNGHGHPEALKHLQKALHLLRSRLSAVDVDVNDDGDGLAISSFLLAHFSIMIGDHNAAKKHLRGMSLVLSKLENNNNATSGGERPSTGDSFPSPLTTDKLTILIWRMAIRIDFISSIACGQEPVLPKYSISKIVLIL